MKKPQEYEKAYKDLKHEVYQSIVTLMKKLDVDKVDLSKNEDGETYKDEGWYNGECVYLTNIADERRFYIVEVALSNDSLYFTMWDEDKNETFEDPEFDRTFIDLADLVYIYWNIYEQFGLFENPQEETEE